MEREQLQAGILLRQLSAQPTRLRLGELPEVTLLGRTTLLRLVALLIPATTVLRQWTWRFALVRSETNRLAPFLLHQQCSGCTTSAKLETSVTTTRNLLTPISST